MEITVHRKSLCLLFFQLKADTIFITEEYDGQSEFADDDGTFKILGDAITGSSFSVEGEFVNGNDSINHSESSCSSSSTSSTLGAFKRPAASR